MDNENQSVEHELDQIERSPEYQEALIRHRDAYRKIQRIMLPEIPLIVLVIVEAAEKPARERKAIEPAEKLTRLKGRWGSRRVNKWRAASVFAWLIWEVAGREPVFVVCGMGIRRPRSCIVHTVGVSRMIGVFVVCGVGIRQPRSCMVHTVGGSRMVGIW